MTLLLDEEAEACGVHAGSGKYTYHTAPAIANSSLQLIGEKLSQLMYVPWPTASFWVALDLQGME